MTRTRSILVVGVVAALVVLAGCRDGSDQAVRAGDGTATSGEAPASSQNPAVATPSAQAPDGTSAATPAGAGIAETVLVLLGPAGLSVPGIGVELGYFGPGGVALTPDGATGSGASGPGAGFGAGTATGIGTGAGTGGGTGTNPGTGPGAGAGSGSGAGTGTNASNTAAGFCAPAKSLDSALAAVGAARDPGTLRSAVARARSAFGTARAAAIASLVGDVDVLAGAYGQLFGNMEAAGYDLNRLSVGAFSPLLTPEVKASSGRLRDFVNNDC